MTEFIGNLDPLGRLSAAPDFERLLTTLADARVKYVVIGGIAGWVHGSGLSTVDVDVVYERSDENLSRLAAALAPLRPYLRGTPPGLPFRLDPPTLRAGLNFTLITDAGPLDLLGEMAGGGNYHDLLPHSREATFLGGTHLCLTLDALIRAKRAAGRPKDFQAISVLEALREEQGDSTDP